MSDQPPEQDGPRRRRTPATPTAGTPTAGTPSPRTRTPRSGTRPSEHDEPTPTRRPRRAAGARPRPGEDTAQHADAPPADPRPPAPAADPAVGSLPEEAAKLAEALADWLRDGSAGRASRGHRAGVWSPPPGEADLLGADIPERDLPDAETLESLLAGHEPATCGFCPLCRLIEHLDQTNPMVAEAGRRALLAVTEFAVLAVRNRPRRNEPAAVRTEKIVIQGDD